MSRQQWKPLIPFIVLVGGMGAVFLFGGFYVLSAQRDGTPATATVTDCETRRFRQTTIVCTGTWFDNGRVVRGTIDGANSGHEGKRIEVRLRGGRAYTTSLRLPVILFAIAALFLAGGAYQVIHDLRRPRGPESHNGSAPGG